MRSRAWVTNIVMAVAIPISITACDRFAAAPDIPTVFVMNMTGTPLTVVVYDYTTPVGGFPGIYLSPEFKLGQVSSSGSACLTFAGLATADAFALGGEDTLVAVQTRLTNTFVPRDAPGWTVTFANDTAGPIGPTATTKGCSPS